MSFKNILIFIILSLLAIAIVFSNNKNVHVSSYTKSDGTFVKEHYRSKP